MACLREKVEAGVAGAVVTGGGVGLVASTATGPAFFAAAVAWLAACFKFGECLGDLATCLERNGQPEYAQKIRQTAEEIAREADAFKKWAESVGAAL
jgi:hypothetical protein